METTSDKKRSVELVQSNELVHRNTGRVNTTGKSDQDDRRVQVVAPDNDSQVHVGDRTIQEEAWAAPGEGFGGRTKTQIADHRSDA